MLSFESLLFSIFLAHAKQEVQKVQLSPKSFLGTQSVGIPTYGWDQRRKQNLWELLFHRVLIAPCTITCSRSHLGRRANKGIPTLEVSDESTDEVQTATKERWSFQSGQSSLRCLDGFTVSIKSGNFICHFRLVPSVTPVTCMCDTIPQVTEALLISHQFFPLCSCLPPAF